MPAPALTWAQITALGLNAETLASFEPLLPQDRPLTIADAHSASATLDEMLCVAEKAAEQDADIKRRLYMWFADCATRILPIHEEQNPGDTRLREAIPATRAYASGELDAVAAADAERDLKRTIWPGADAAWATRRAAEGAGDVTDTADAAELIERTEQLALFLLWFGDVEPEPLPLPPVLAAV